MGATITFLESEKKAWIEHDLQYDAQIREANLSFLDLIQVNSKLSICRLL